jgi:hypothetical protein
MRYLPVSLQTTRQYKFEDTLLELVILKTLFCFPLFWFITLRTAQILPLSYHFGLGNVLKSLEYLYFSSMRILNNLYDEFFIHNTAHLFICPVGLFVVTAG